MDAFSGHCHFLFATGSITAEQNGGLYCIAVKDLDDVPRRAPLAKVLLTPTHLPIESGVSHALFARRIALSMWTHELFSPGMPPEECRSVLGARISNEDVVLPPCEVVLRSRHNEILGFRIVPTFDYVDETFGVRYRVTFLGACRGPSFETWHQLEHVCWPSDLVTSGIVSKQVQIHKHVRKSFVKQLLCTRDGQRIVLESSGMATITTPRLSISLSHISRGKYTPGINALSQLALLPIREPRVIVGVTKEENIVFYQIDDWKVHYLPVVAEESLPLSLLQVLEAKAPEASFNVTILDLKTARLIEHQRVLVVVQLLLQSKTSSVQDTHLVGVKVGVSGRRVSLKVAFDFFYKMTAFGPGLVVSSSLEMLTHYKAHFDEGISSLVAMCDLDEPDPLDQVTTCSFALSHGVGSHTILATSPVLSFSELTRPHVGLYAVELDFRNEIAAFDLGKHSVLALGISSQTLLVLTTKLHILLVPLSGVGMQFTTLCATARIEIGRPFRRWAETRGESTVVDEPKRLKLLQKFKSKVRRGSTVEEQLPPGAFLQRLYNIYKAFKVGGVNVSHRHNSFLIQLHHGLGAPAERTVCDARCAVLITTNRMPKMHWTSLNVETTGRETHGWLSGIRAGLLISDDAFAAYTLSESAVLATVDGQITEFQRAVGKERHLMCTAENLLDLLHSRRMHLLRELLLRTGQVFAAFSREKSKAHQALEASLFPTKDYGILNLLLDPFLGLSFESKTKPSSIGTEADVPVAHRDPLSSSVTHPATPAGAATNVDMDFDSDAFDVDLFGSSSSSEDEEATALEKEFTALAKHGSEPPDGLISEDLIDYLLLCCDAFSEGLPDFLDASEMQRLKFFLSAFSKISQLRLQASCLLLEDWQVEAHYRGGLATSGHTLDDTPSTTADYALGDPSLQVEPVSLTALLSGYVNRDQESFLLSEALSIARAVGGGKLQWRILGSLGIAVWLESPAAVDTLLDDLTKDAFKHRRYPDDVAFWHCLRNKPVALSLLYRKDDRTRVAELFADTDLQSDKGRAVMVRNGFQLLSKKRHLYAAGCFLLAHAWSEAFDAIVRQVGDFHLGILVARVLDNRHVTPPEDSSFLHWLTRKWLSQESPAALWLLWSLSRDHLKAALTIVVPPEGPGDTEWRPLSVTGNLDLGTTSPLLYTALRKKNQLLLAQQLSGIGHVGVDVKDKAMYEEAIHDPTDFQRYHLGDVRISPLDLYEMSQLAGQGQDELTMRKLKASLIAPNLRSSGQDLLQMQILSCLDKPAAVETVSRYLFQLVSPPPEAVHLAILGYASYLASPLLHSEVQLPAAPSTLHCLIASHPDKLFQRLKTEIVSPVEQVVVDPLMPSHWISTGLVLAGSPYWRRLLGLLLLEQCMESYFRESFRACDFSTSLVCFRIRCFSLLRFYLEVLCNVCPELPMRLGSEPPPLSLFSHLFSPGLLSAFESLRGPVALQNICLLQPRLFLEDVKPISAEVHMSPCPIDLKSQVLYNFTPRTFRVLEAARFPEHLSKAVGFCQGILLVNTTSGLMEISTSRIKEDYVTGHGPVCDPNTLLVSLKLQQKSIVGSLPVTVSADTVQPATSITELHEEYCDLAAHLLARGLFPQPLGGVDSSLGIGLRLPYGPLSLWLKFELSEAMRLSNSLLSSLSTSLAKSQIHASHGMVLLHGQYPLLFLGLQTPVETETEWLTVAVYHYQKRKLEERSCLGYFGLPKSGHDSPDKVISMSLLQGGHRILVACASGLVALYQISYCGKGSHLPFITFRPHLFGLSAVVVDSGPALIIATGGRGMCSVGVERLAATMQAKGDPKPEIDRVSTALESDVPLTCLWQWRQSTHSVEPLLVDIGWSRHAEVRRIVRDSVTQKLFVCLSTGAPRVIDIPNRTCSNLIQNVSHAQISTQMDATTSWVDMCLLKDSLVLLSTTCRVVVINTITQAIVADVLASSLPETPTLGSLMQSAFSIHKTSHEALGVVPMADGVVVLLRHGVVKMRL
ncbi:MAG: hypothetical protein KVP17_001739 [Porospora cf. gigantea B]|uniref:uncharacterized protein n=1 Tax=Porospora cf. gigantea B TaxID=2853592 RepID=UPI0035718885|nr:MAG: hypothetical protein KVP17_001739 [Porospora cf. gigantea B]